MEVFNWEQWDKTQHQAEVERLWEPLALHGLDSIIDPEEEEEEGWSGAGGTGRCLPDTCLSAIRSGVRSRNGIWHNKGTKHRNGLFIGQECAWGQTSARCLFPKSRCT